MSDTKALTTRLAALEAAVVADIMTTMGLENQVAAHNIRPLNTDWKMVGPAICAKGTDNPDIVSLRSVGS